MILWILDPPYQIAAPKSSILIRQTFKITLFHPQGLLDDVWTGRMKTKQVSTSYYMNVLFNMIFPLQIANMFEFESDNNNDNDNVFDDNNYDDVQVTKGRNQV